MAEQGPAIPFKLVALVLVPFLLGLLLLGVLFDLGATGWALVYVVVFGTVIIAAVATARLLLLQKQNESVDSVES